MDLYDVKYDENVNSGEIYAISLVGDDEEPANTFDIVTMSDNQKDLIEVKFAADDKELRMVYAIVLRAEQKVTRKKDNQLIAMKFSKDAIRGFSQEFLAKGYQLNSSWNHDYNQWLKGLSVTESWLVADGNNDKGNAIGLKVETDDWCVGIKLSQELWDEYVVTKRIKGVSIDAFISMNKVSMSKIIETENKEISDNSLKLKKINKDKMSKKNFMRSFIKLFENVKFASITVDGVDLTADAFELDEVVTMEDENGDMIPVGVKVFQDGGFEYETDADGKIVRKDEVKQDEETPAPDSNLEQTTAKKEKQTLSGELGAYIELPVGVNTLADGTVVTVEEVTEGEGDTAFTYNSIVSYVPAETSAPETTPSNDAVQMSLLLAKLQEDLEKLTKNQNEVLIENEKLKSLPTDVKMKSISGYNKVETKTLTSREKMVMALLQK